MAGIVFEEKLIAVKLVQNRLLRSNPRQTTAVEEIPRSGGL